MPVRGRHPQNRLTDLVVRRACPGRHADGNGLYLYVRPSGSRSWIQRLVVHGERKDRGLGGYPLIPLAQVRRLAEENRRVARSGGDPFVSRQSTSAPPVRDIVEEVIQTRRAGWRSPHTEKKWRRHFRDMVFPSIGDKPVDKVTLEDLKPFVLPRWQGRGSPGYVLLQYLNSVFEWAAAHGHRMDNPAQLVKVLTQDVKAPVVSHSSLPYEEAPDAMRKVEASEHDPAVKMALVFTVLCAARVGEVSGVTWHEIDLVRRIWTRPAKRMKSHLMHQVPLSQQAIELLEQAKALGRPGPLVFAVPQARRGGFRSVTGHDFRKVLRPFGFADEEHRPIVMHGFRSTFAVWAMEVAEAPEDLWDKALAHGQPSSTTERYGRSKLLERRRGLMQDWADYVLPRPRGR